MSEHSMSMVLKDDGSIFLRAEITEGEFVAKPILSAEEAELQEKKTMTAYTRFVETDTVWTEFEQRYDLGASPLYGSNGFATAHAGTVILTADEWAAISVASRMYSYVDGVDEVTGLEHKRVRAVLAGLMERRP